MTTTTMLMLQFKKHFFFFYIQYSFILFLSFYFVLRKILQKCALNLFEMTQSATLLRRHQALIEDTYTHSWQKKRRKKIHVFVQIGNFMRLCNCIPILRCIYGLHEPNHIYLCSRFIFTIFFLFFSLVEQKKSKIIHYNDTTWDRRNWIDECLRHSPLQSIRIATIWTVLSWTMNQSSIDKRKIKSRTTLTNK